MKNYIVADEENLMGKFPAHAVYCGKDWLDDGIRNVTGKEKIIDE